MRFFTKDKLFAGRLMVTLCVLLCLGVGKSFAKTSSGNFMIKNDLSGMPLQDVLHWMQEEGNVTFVYDVNQVDLNLDLELNTVGKTVGEVITHIKSSTDLDFVQKGETYFIKKKEENIKIDIDPAGEKEVKGTVKSAGEELIGVNVLIKGKNEGTITDVNGEFSLNVSPDDVLVFSFMGYSSVEIPVGNQSFIDVVMKEDFHQLDEIVVTGVAAAVPKSKLSITVEALDQQVLQNVPGTDVSSSLQGKIAGVRISGGTGAPGSNASIQLRGATSLSGSSDPLIIIDGVMTEGNLSDINMEDIDRMEVVKGAAASSLYGSRAANGVINITTKRGALQPGKTSISYRTEVGANVINYIPEKNSATNNRVENGEVLWGTSTPDSYYDNPYPKNDHDPFKQFFRPGNFQTHYLSGSGSSKDGNTSFFSSMQYMNEEGVIRETDGRQRLNMRLNVDHKINERLKFSASNLYVDNQTDNRAGQGTMDGFLYADPNVDFYALNDDGSPYKVNPNNLSRTINPLYELANTINETRSNRFLGNYRLNYEATNFLDLSAAYGIDRRNSRSFNMRPKGMLRVEGAPEMGSIGESTSVGLAQTLQLDMALHKKFGDFGTRLKFQYLYEANKNQSHGGGGTNLATTGLGRPNLGMASENLYAWSNTSTVVANNFSGALFLDYKDKVIVDMLLRRDGVSLFGSEERWQNFYRFSGAYRLNEDLKLPRVQEMKLRASYGVAGLRPPFEAQYEVIGVDNGQITTPQTMGNVNLKPSFAKELEVGFDVAFLDRFMINANYARSVNTDQILKVPVSAASGFAYQWDNIGTLESNVFEITLHAKVMEKKNFRWDANVTFDRIRQKVQELNRSGFSVVSGGIFRIEEGETLGAMYGQKFATSLNEVSNQVAEGVNVADVFTINNHGYVVRRDQIGTSEEVPMFVLNDDGSRKDMKIGDSNPDFNMNWGNTFTWKGLSVYALLGYQHGGDLVNHSRRYMMVNQVAAEMDATKMGPGEAKAARYYNELTTSTSTNSHFIEDATFLRLRELSVNYSFSKQQLDRMGLGFFQAVKVGFIGRNLFTLTKYSGFDPEGGYSGSESEGLSPNILKFDTSSYPPFSTFSGSLSITF
ncbi:SusC/RagA family TonB-linked outer membrane protein [Aureibacter tunicatorum]|uniref:TonB-linked SusC/RagA family outer membrane protein n=1 Tax=Aureibacter tunicatorum TaxID=866807 RepID=A0AAE3XNN5_9BACT|nr:SusC/RagA family TonB-linked outer membrane protein [Aureibacter tunicatorum]MDR6240287.1 TonB-linked SusC/RagA family outer membrane protein [Aureibacter tunicatorum]BDD05832.1 SusC/RagA family TonB-linked outer membrane protein [Aureibacter tunicatorum]